MRAAADVVGRRVRRWGGLLLGVTVAAALLWWHRPISDALWPSTRIQQLRIDAARALDAGQLSRSDGTGARELYESALALDPDRDGARDGLVRVGQAALARAGTQIDAGRLEDARESLQLARELGMPQSSTQAVATRLESQEIGATGVERLLQQAGDAREAGRLDGGDDAALALYQQVLAWQSNNVEALEGREDTLSELLQQARQGLEDGKLTAAASLVERTRQVDPGHIDLPRTEGLLAVKIDQRLLTANADLRRGRLTRALEGYGQVAAIHEGNPDAARGRLQVANAHAARSRRHAADFRIREAQLELDAAQSIAPDAPAVIDARSHLTQARLLQSRLQSTLPPGQRQKRLRELLDAAGAAEARGDLLLPPGDSAYDKLRSARAIAPDDPSVIAMVARLRPAAKECFATALRRNRLTTAGGCLDAYAVLEGDDAVVRTARRQLAQRWIAVGDERLGAGDLPLARRALESARSLDPSAEGLDAFARRVGRARLPAP